MPYYLSPIEKTDIQYSTGKFIRRPRLSDIVGANWVCLNDHALLWLPMSVGDPLLTEIVANKTDKPAAAKITALEIFLGDRTISINWTLIDILKDVLLNPKAQKWAALQPSFARQRQEIWLGPPEDKVFWSQAQAVTKKSKQYSDNFNRSAANLDGSAFSDGSGVQWSEVIGAVWTGANNRAEANDLPTWTDEIAIANTDLDTDSMLAQANLVVWTRAADSYLNTAIYAKTNISASSGYIFFLAVDQSNVASRNLYAMYSDVMLASDAVLTTSGIICVVVDGSSISAKVDGTTVLGPVTHSGEPGGAGNRRCGIGGFGGVVSTNDIAFDDFMCQDMSFGQTVDMWHPKIQQPRKEKLEIIGY